MRELESADRCPVCNNAVDTTIPLYRKEHRARSIAVLRCEGCGLAFLSESSEHFEDDLYAYYQRRLEWPEDKLYDPLTEARYQTLLADLATQVPEQSVLDVGCGKGHWLKVVSQEGWRSRGIDLAEGAVELCRRFALPADQMDFFDASLDGQRYGLVTMFELIEHVPNPAAFIRRASELLVPGGLLYLTTPNFACLDRRVLGADWPAIHPEHVTYFDPKTVTELVRRSGAPLSIERVESRNVSGATLRRLATFWRRDASRDAGSKLSPTPTPAAAAVEQHNAQERALRRHIENSGALRALKQGLNAVLDRADAGNAMFVRCRRVGD